MGFWEFWHQHTFLAFCALFLAFAFAKLPFILVNRWIRHRNIVAKGWPPAHLDADGDPIKKPEEA